MKEESNRQRYGRDYRQNNKNVVLYCTAGVLTALAASYAAVPIYRIYCQQTGKGGKAFVDENEAKIERMALNKSRKITIKLAADTESQMAWDFKPTIPEVTVMPGETALAFFTARNPTSVPINGVSTYTVQPYEAGLYLNKIQCFCFEEQRLNPKEEVDMPVFFYIDPEYAEDPRLENIDVVTLAYCFFKTEEGAPLPALNPDYPAPPHLLPGSSAPPSPSLPGSKALVS